MPYDKVVDSAALDASLASIGNSIRAKNGSSITYTLEDMPAAIYAIKTGGDDNYTKALLEGTIEDLVIPSYVTKIKNRAFMNDYNLKSCTLGENVSMISEYAFYACSSMSSIDVSPAENSLIYIMSNSFYGSNITSFIANSSLKQVHSGAFYNCKKLANVVLNDGLEYMGGDVFRGCEKLLNINIPESVTTIGSSVFLGTGLTEIPLFPISINIIKNSMFKNCKKLTDVSNLRNSIITLDTNVFQNCTGLVNVVIPENVESIGNYAFDGCSSLNSIHMKPTAPPAIYIDTFRNVPATFYVPIGSLNAYRTATNWSAFADRIQEEEV